MGENDPRKAKKKESLYFPKEASLKHLIPELAIREKERKKNNTNSQKREKEEKGEILHTGQPIKKGG